MEILKVKEKHGCMSFQTSLTRTNKWLYEAKGQILGSDVRSRCLHKVSQDFARLTVSVAEGSGMAELALFGPTTSLVDQASGIGISCQTVPYRTDRYFDRRQFWTLHRLQYDVCRGNHVLAL